MEREKERSGIEEATFATIATITNANVSLPCQGFDTARGIVKTTYETVGYMFQTPEAWDAEGHYRALSYMRPLSIWGMQVLSHSLSLSLLSSLPPIQFTNYHDIIRHPHSAPPHTTNPISSFSPSLHGRSLLGAHAPILTRPQWTPSLSSTASIPLTSRSQGSAKAPLQALKDLLPHGRGRRRRAAISCSIGQLRLSMQGLR